MSLQGLQFVVVGDLDDERPGQQNGGVEIVVQLEGVIEPNGIFLLAVPSYKLRGAADQIESFNFEYEQNLTFFLAQNFTLSVGDTVDSDNNGMLDPDAISVVDSLGIRFFAGPPDGVVSNFI